MKQQNMIFASLLRPGAPDKEVCIWAESIRKHGGRWAGSPLWLMVPENLNRVSSGLARELLLLDVQLRPYEIGKPALEFPFAHKAFAAAGAEQKAQGQCDILVMMDPDSVVIRPPDEMLLPEQTGLAAAPVMLKLVGLPWDQPDDGFWSLIYRHCGVKPEKMFPVITTVDRQKIKAYFNAGLLAVRPRSGVFRKWRDDFASLFQTEELRSHYKNDRLYAIFVHQAVLAGSLLSLFRQDQIRLFSPNYNYPVMLYDQMSNEQRRVVLDEMVTIRYDEYQADPVWLKQYEMGEQLRSWLGNKFHGSSW